MSVSRNKPGFRSLRFILAVASCLPPPPPPPKKKKLYIYIYIHIYIPYLPIPLVIFSIIQESYIQSLSFSFGQVGKVQYLPMPRNINVCRTFLQTLHRCMAYLWYLGILAYSNTHKSGQTTNMVSKVCTSVHWIALGKIICRYVLQELLKLEYIKYAIALKQIIEGNFSLSTVHSWVWFGIKFPMLKAGGKSV